MLELLVPRVTRPGRIASLAACALTGLGLAACAPGDREVLVTRDQIGESWPLEVNSAKVVCSDDDKATHVRLGLKLYGLSDAAVADGYPSVDEILRSIPADPRRPQAGSWPADPSALAAACETAPGDVAAR